MMLEVRNLKKVYKVKNSDPVYALNDVSVKFPEKGLIFILGKSGSGKSTLLNVMGGLDKADSGEIIINGKSSKEFSGSEMDSYRNTYLGFIFQEYNILSDFTIKENIALALQLQHKPVTDEAINNILKEVDLEGFGKRKPNELSGGQKQRVAIARALVKEPKIIFGDEPTGALDSNTGKQVFETLKKLSKDKLVVIVSHDRDFAEHFGDRVIELRDGKIISDISKTTCEVESPSEGLSIMGDNIIRIEKDHELTVKDLKIINEKLASRSSEIYITADEHINDAVCEAGRIDKEGNRERFVDTDQSSIKVGDEKFALIKSHFSMKHAFRMGAKSLKVKPGRLVLTILLSTVAFSLFGFSATLSMFNTKNALTSTIEKNDIHAVSFTFEKRGPENEEGEATSLSTLSKDKLESVQTATGAKVYTLTNTDKIQLITSANADVFHMSTYYGSVGVDAQVIDEFGLTYVSGKAPAAENEICISKYALYTYEDLGFYSFDASGKATKVDNIDEQSIIGQCIYSSKTDEKGNVTNTPLKIVGVVDTKYPTKYEKYRKDSSSLTARNTDTITVAFLRASTNLHNVIYQYSEKPGINITSEVSGDNATAFIAFGKSIDYSKVSKFLDLYAETKDAFKDESKITNDTYKLTFVDPTLANVETYAKIIGVLTQVFVWVGLAFGIFALLLFYNFISISINSKKVEIGILRAVGAKRSDVFKIFYSESFIIALINFILATAITFYISFDVNVALVNAFSLAFNVMSPNILVVLMILGVALGASIISSILPVTRLANKKPIDAIHNK
jgi:putative ABC transport system permease protein